MMPHKFRVLAFLILTTVAMVSCDSDFVPKRTGYNRIELPDHEYVPIQEKHPYSFQHSVYAKVMPHESRLTEPHWIDVYYPGFDASVQLTYKVLDENERKKTDLKETILTEITNDARKLTNQHNIKAFAIEESQILNPKGITSFVFELEGEVPSQFQFYSTDSTDNFLRGALYFKTATKNDSLAPVIEYIKSDIIHMLNTLEWVEE